MSEGLPIHRARRRYTIGFLRSWAENPGNDAPASVLDKAALRTDERAGQGLPIGSRYSPRIKGMNSNETFLYIIRGRVFRIN